MFIMSNIHIEPDTLHIIHLSQLCNGVLGRKIKIITALQQTLLHRMRKSSLLSHNLLLQANGWKNGVLFANSQQFWFV